MPHFTFAWSLVRGKGDPVRKVKVIKFRLPQRRRSWALAGLAVILLAALIVSLVVVNHGSSYTASRCYAKGTFDGLDIYLQTNRTTMQSCSSAAKGSGLTNLSSLPAGLQRVCSNETVTVYMQPDQIATVHDLGLNPATICS